MPGSLQDCATLQNGVQIPRVGLGVFRTKMGDEIADAVRFALEAGYRSFDTAQAYQNEQGLGDAIKESGVPREQLFLTTKINNPNQGYESTLRTFEESREKLGVDYLDLVLIHWPGQDPALRAETWRALEKLYRDGAVRAIGVSNYEIPHLEELLAGCEVAPMVDQVERHPLLNQAGLLAYCKAHQIQLEAWSPIMKGNLDHPVLAAVARRHGKSPAQVVLRWHLQQGVVVIPKSVHRDRIFQNADLFDFALSDVELEAIDAMHTGHRFGPDPAVFF